MKRLLLCTFFMMSTTTCALDPFGDAGEGATDRPAAEQARRAAEARGAAVASEREAVARLGRRDALMSTPATGATRIGTWTGQGEYGGRALTFQETFWASPAEPLLATNELRSRAPQLPWREELGADPGEFVARAFDGGDLYVVYARPGQVRYVTGSDARATLEPAPPGTRSFITVAHIVGAAAGAELPSAPSTSTPPA